MTIAAKFEDGVFKPLKKVHLKDGTLLEFHLPAKSTAASPKIKETPFGGLSKNRTDITDSDDYIQRLRRDLHGK